MEVIKFIFEILICFIVTCVSLAIALIPAIVYQCYGGTDEVIDFALRCVGFCIWLLMFVWYFRD